MKRLLSLIVGILLFTASFAQVQVMVQGNYPDLFITHKVAGKESLYSIGRVFNLPPAQIAKANGLSENAMLSLGQEIKIPLTKSNFTQDGQKADNEMLVGVYHIVAPGENLFRICQTYGKPRVDFVREWNDLNKDVIQPSQKIVIGHLKVAKNKSGDINAVIGATTASTSANDNGYDVSAPEVAGTTTTTTPVINTAPPATTEEPVKNTTTDKTTTPSTTPAVSAKPEEVNPGKNAEGEDEGFFVTEYPSEAKDKQAVSKSGDAATFKTTSGWTDRKYYVLVNDIPAGSVVRISANGKSICAKVLGTMPEMKENKNLLLRISNAAASALRITDDKFAVTITYLQ